MYTLLNGPIVYCVQFSNIVDLNVHCVSYILDSCCYIMYSIILLLCCNYILISQIATQAANCICHMHSYVAGLSSPLVYMHSSHSVHMSCDDSHYLKQSMKRLDVVQWIRLYVQHSNNISE